MRHAILFILALALTDTACAGLETDRTVGNCIGLLATLNKPAKMKEALSLADNRNRAQKFASAWLDEANRYHASGKDDLVKSMAFSATGDCRDIGIRASD